MKTILALCIVMVFAGCALLETAATDPILVKAAARAAAQGFGKEANLSKEKAEKIASYLDKVEEALPVVLPPNFDKARSTVTDSDLDDIEKHVLLLVIDYAEAEGAEYLKDKQIPVAAASGEMTPEEKEKIAKIEEYRKILEAVLVGAKEGLRLIK